jgi:hypothetical protein
MDRAELRRGEPTAQRRATDNTVVQKKRRQDHRREREARQGWTIQVTARPHPDGLKKRSIVMRSLLHASRSNTSGERRNSHHWSHKWKFQNNSHVAERSPFGSVAFYFAQPRPLLISQQICSRLPLFSERTMRESLCYLSSWRNKR